MMGDLPTLGYYRLTWSLYHRKSFVFHIAFDCSELGTITLTEPHTPMMDLI